MNNIIKVCGDVFAVVGLLVCVIASVSRILHHYHIAGFETITLFIIGIALMVAAILAKVHLLQHSTHKGN